MNSATRFSSEHGRADSPPRPPRAQPQAPTFTETLFRACQDQFTAATQHPFLIQAGKGNLSKQDLSRWLSQDRLYAETYICFISSLIAKVTLPYSYNSDKHSSLRWRTIGLLTDALTNIRRELDFFTDVANHYDLKLDLPFSGNTSDAFRPNATTEQYLTLFRSFNLDVNQTLLEGLIVLWATEKCYLHAWSYARIFMEAKSSSEDADGGALQKDLIPNWTSKEFETFVQDIAELTDEWAAREGALRKIEVYKALWLHVLEIEKGFWPNITTE